MDQLEVKYGKGQVAEYQKDILSMQVCPLFLQQIFVTGEEQDSAMVKMEEYMPMLSLEHLREEEGISIMISLLTGMIEAERRYMFIGEYRVDVGVLCVSRDLKKARLVFVPRHYTNQVALFQDLIGILRHMENKVPAEDGRFLREGIEYIAKGNGSLTRMRQRFVLLHRKVREE
ncbi:hypothetical protein [Eubacterium sp. AB3007]|uniref:hypothetical protein n=1 Tax=Eubacterium sp. AB3007 TaxID=1392487 RepID=UPI00048A382E|nr:hypothetical protein [Eubacterium sp. AB3007]